MTHTLNQVKSSFVHEIYNHNSQSHECLVSLRNYQVGQMISTRSSLIHIWFKLHYTLFLYPNTPEIKQSCHPLDHLRILYPFSKHSVCLNLMYELKWTLMYSGPKNTTWTSSKVGSFMLKWNHFAFDYSWENNETNLSRRLWNEVLFKFRWSGTWFFLFEDPVSSFHYMLAWIKGFRLFGIFKTFFTDSQCQIRSRVQ